MTHHNSDITTTDVEGMLPLGERIFDPVEINSCCRSGRSSREPEERFPEDLVEFLTHGEPDMDVHDAIYMSSDLPIEDLVRFVLKECHRPLCERLLNLDALIKMVENSHGDEREVGETTRRIRGEFDVMRDVMLGHLLKEEDVLFPWIVSGNGDSAPEVIEEVNQQHKTLASRSGQLLRDTARLMGQSNACSGQRALHKAMRDFVTAIAVHINVEDHVLYPRAGSVQG